MLKNPEHAPEFIPWVFDIPMHFFGGLAAGLSYISLIKIGEKHHIVGKMNKFIAFIFILSLVALTAVLWEFMEFTIDFLFGFGAQQGQEDTMFDLFLGLIGGFGAYFFSLFRH